MYTSLAQLITKLTFGIFIGYCIDSTNLVVKDEHNTIFGFESLREYKISLMIANVLA